MHQASAVGDFERPRSACAFLAAQWLDDDRPVRGRQAVRLLPRRRVPASNSRRVRLTALAANWWTPRTCWRRSSTRRTTQSSAGHTLCPPDCVAAIREILCRIGNGQAWPVSRDEPSAKRRDRLPVSVAVSPVAFATELRRPGHDRSPGAMRRVSAVGDFHGGRVPPLTRSAPGGAAEDDLERAGLGGFGEHVVCLVHVVEVEVMGDEALGFELMARGRV